MQKIHRGQNPNKELSVMILDTSKSKLDCRNKDRPVCL